MSDHDPEAESAHKRRLGSTLLGCLFLGWFLGAGCGAALGNVGLGALVGICGGVGVGLLVLLLVGEFRPRDR